MASEQQYEDTKTNNIPPYFWIPPIEPELKETPPEAFRQMKRHEPDPTKPKPSPSADPTIFPSERIARIRDHAGVPGGKGFEASAALFEDADMNEEKQPGIPHPFSYYDHLDPVDWGPNVNDVRQLGPRMRASFSRLKASFDWIVLKISELHREINLAVQGKLVDRSYKAVRDEYINLIRNLDNHEPRGKDIDPPKCLGYGKNIKWVFVDPYIKATKVKSGETFNLIDGAAIVIEWNPHSSSSGIAIQH